MKIKTERKLLLGFSAVFLALALMVFGYGMTTRAEDTLVDYDLYPYRLHAQWQHNQSTSGNYYERNVDFVSKYPIIGWSNTNELNNIQLVLVDYENKEYYGLLTEKGVDMWYMDYGRSENWEKEKGTLVGVQYETTGSLYVGGGQLHLLSVVLGDQGVLYDFTGKVFANEDYLKSHIETGSLDGLLHDGTPVEENRDFGEKYDPDVPIPQLAKLSHNGFTVKNNSNMLELDLVVDSYFYGLKHNEKKINTKHTFEVDKSNLVSQHHYDGIINSEIGFTGSDVVLTNSPTFNCKNRFDLFNDGLAYFNEYPRHSDLPDYNYFYYESKDYELIWDEYVAAFDVGNLDLDGALALTGQAYTKYYVRFRQLESNGDGTYGETNGQWYCYTYNTDGNITVSPVDGDENGDPIETDPENGEQDEDGDPDYGGGGGGNLPDIDTSNPLAMLKDFIEFLTSMPDMVGELSDFFSAVFCFIPDKYWDLIIIGVGFAVVFLIFSLIKK